MKPPISNLQNPRFTPAAEDELKKVAREVAACTRCALHFSRKNAVPGDGPANADIMFIGEGPGFHENEQGKPFVGPAGKFLDELLQSVGMKRSEVFIGNVVKCRPPGNRDPEPVELVACGEYLDRQIQAINPKVIVTLGRFSMAHFLPSDPHRGSRNSSPIAKISDIHGQAMRVRGRLVVAMYHPAAALHQASLKPVLIEDFSRLPELIALELSRSESQAPEEQEVASEKNEPKKEETDKPQQLSLF